MPLNTDTNNPVTRNLNSDLTQTEKFESTQEPKQTLPNNESSIKINSDGSWNVILPPTEEGVTLESEHGEEFMLNKGDVIEISASGYVDIGRGLVGPDGEPNYSDTTVDSPYKNHVGGIEMWIGPNKYIERYFVGRHLSITVERSGIPTLRVIESLHGYHDGNTGTFSVNIKKISGN